MLETPGVLSLVAVAGDVAVAHAVFTHCGLGDRTHGAALLGPLAVAQTWQRRGIGRTLVRAGLDRLRGEGVGRVCVLGDPGYYARFGFAPERAIARRSHCRRSGGMPGNHSVWTGCRSATGSISEKKRNRGYCGPDRRRNLTSMYRLGPAYRSHPRQDAGRSTHLPAEPCRLFRKLKQHQLAPTLNPGDVRILDTLSGHDSARARAALAERGACFLLLQECSPDQKPIEMAFAKLKAHLRVAEARIYETLWYRIAGIYDLFQPEACWNVIRQAGYVHE